MHSIDIIIIIHTIILINALLKLERKLDPGEVVFQFANNSTGLNIQKSRVAVKLGGFPMETEIDRMRPAC